MLFNDPKFFIFLMIVFALISFGTTKYKKVILFIASYVFYGWWDWRFLSLLWISSMVDFIIGKTLYQTKEQKKRKMLLTIAMVTNLGLLGVFKYFNFFVDSFVKLSGIGPSSIRVLHIVLPVGISFYTFQAMSYTIDIYRKEIKPAKTLLDYLNFVAFFPQLVAGPIERAHNLLPQVEEFKGLKLTRAGLRVAMVLLLMGYIKKVLVSDNIAPITDRYFSNFAELGSIYALSGVILFSFQIYFDFSGYSDIARGLAKFFGIELMHNFKQPYLAVSPSDFWRRWHISLSSWLRDYLYIPLGGNRKGKHRTNVNLMTTMLLGGLWHGASWNFVLWGGLHGMYLVIEKIFFKGKEIIKKRWAIITTIVSAVVVYILVLFTWIPFRTSNFEATWAYFKKIIFWTGGVNPAQLLFLVFIFGVWLLIDLPAEYYKDQAYLLKLPRWLFAVIAVIGVSGVVLTMMSYHANVRPFIYFQF
ncbi:MAG: MBOAT family protein [Candidatus Omnitrophica bacterium]|nr:MBOAT family protein [Candidatus Omnitrophota bacterium]